MTEWTISADGAVVAPIRSPVASLWLVAALLVFHQVALTVIHYGIGPALGLDPGGAWLVSATIGVAAILVLLIITPGRSHAILLILPRWNARTFGTMLVGLAIAQIPLGILALQGVTVWQAGAGSNLDVGRALLASISGPSGLALLAATVLVAPMIEELLYRGYLVGALIERIPAAVVAVISAVLFVTLHFEPANLVASLCLGLGAGLCAVRTRSVLPGMFVHIASNGFGMWYATLG
ncbi:CPBP family intramembrane glutamic endopeptidase [Novosphingobium sp. P6W]|uniref:CPBP family intramembrane glutamic endopeptidase n=1 Tax=Novosphingobium sp. P6W TaxID=1609758 RepID=UPI0005C31684|nr:CPBP family intramembrane glutamic endopeptidase [Novosphingobium sp. P6W]AXB80103.1 CPBP family intramembrane metalloprotease [Novosphingobium sp. P6W]KIS29963.1 hypothetical protein TQ38_25305 [Novosphingobium sp. P6W]